MGASQEFWRSKAALNYPSKLDLGGVEWWEPGEQQRQMVGKEIGKKGWATKGNILDLGAGPCSRYIFGPAAANERVWAVDFSPELLEQGVVPENRRVVADLRSTTFPQEWEGRFDFASAVLFFRYINSQQRRDLMLQVKKTLAPNGRVAIIDFNDLRPAGISQELGEVEVFDPKATAALFHDIGYAGIEMGRWNIVVETGGGDLSPFAVDWVSAVNSS